MISITSPFFSPPLFPFRPSSPSLPRPRYLPPPPPIFPLSFPFSFFLPTPSFSFPLSLFSLFPFLSPSSFSSLFLPPLSFSLPLSFPLSPSSFPLFFSLLSSFLLPLPSLSSWAASADAAIRPQPAAAGSWPRHLTVGVIGATTLPLTLFGRYSHWFGVSGRFTMFGSGWP